MREASDARSALADAKTRARLPLPGRALGARVEQARPALAIARPRARAWPCLQAPLSLIVQDASEVPQDEEE